MRRRISAVLALLVCCPAGGCGSPSERHEKVTTLAAPVNVAPAVGDFVLYGTNSVLVRSRAVVMGGDVGVQLDGDGPLLMSGVELGVDTFANLDPTRNVLGAAIRLKNKCVVGDVHAIVLDCQNCDHGVWGSWPPMPAMPSAFLAAPSAEPLVVPNGGTVQLGPDQARGSVWLKKDALLRLEGGVYHFDDVEMDQGAWVQALPRDHSRRESFPRSEAQPHRTCGWHRAIRGGRSPGRLG
jgi:hypothetical protein